MSPYFSKIEEINILKGTRRLFSHLFIVNVIKAKRPRFYLTHIFLRFVLTGEKAIKGDDATVYSIF